MIKDQQKYIIQAIIFVVVFFNYVKLSTSSSVKNDAQLMKLLMARVNGLQTKLDQVVIKLEEETVLRSHFQILNSELETKVARLDEKFNILQKEFETKINVILMEKLKKNAKNSNAGSNTNNNMNFTKHDNKRLEHRSASQRVPPSSCRKLASIGHQLDGLYLIANPDSNKIETVYCDFGKNPSETLYGNVALITKSVHFHVQRISDFGLENAVISFDKVVLNESGAMNAANGVFTVPTDGIYHFDFAALKEGDANPVYVLLKVNGETVAYSHATVHSAIALSGINAPLRLKMNDQVRLYKTTGTLDGHYIHFSGWLVEEDLLLVS